MSVQSIKVMVPPPVARPRGVDWAPALLAGLSRMGRAVWQEIEAIGQARANGELERLARQHSHNPQVAQLLRAAIRRDAGALRRTP